MFSKFDKAIAPIIITVIMGILGFAGISETMTVGEAIPMIVAAIAVYFVPNKK